MTARALLAVTFIALCGCLAGRPDDLSGEVEKFIKDQEGIVKELAESMKKVQGNRQQLLRECECSLHACGRMSSNSACYAHLGTPDICRGQKEGRMMDNTTSIVRTPPGVTPETLTPSLKESICLYKHLDEEFKEIREEDEIGWMYIGKYVLCLVKSMLMWPLQVRRMAT